MDDEENPRPRRGVRVIKWVVLALLALVIAAAVTVYGFDGTTNYKWDEARTEMYEIRKALDLYWIDNDAYPQTLDQLRGGYFREIPTDPYSRKPYIYEGNGNLFRLVYLGKDQRYGGEEQRDQDIILTQDGEVAQ